MFKQVAEIQSDVWEKLHQIHISKKVGTAYCLSGPPGCGKEGLALTFGALINCESADSFPGCGCSSCLRFQTLQHEHLSLVVPLPANTKKSEEDISTKNIEILNSELDKKKQDLFHKIRVPSANRIILQSIHKLKKSLILRSSVFGRKIAIILDADLLCVGAGESANALLKLLEEPPPLTTIILVTDFKDKLFSTLISRCQHIHVPKLSDGSIQNMLKSKGVEPEKIKWVSCLSEGNFTTACELSSRKWEEVSKTLNIFSDLLSKNDHKNMIKFATEYSKLSFTDKTEFRFHFYMFQRWLLSVFRLQKGLEDDLAEMDIVSGMNQFLDLFPSADIREITFLTDSVVNGLKRNANMSLLLTNFIIQIQKELNRDK